MGPLLTRVPPLSVILWVVLQASGPGLT